MATAKKKASTKDSNGDGKKKVGNAKNARLLSEAVKKVGSEDKAAAMIGCSQQSVSAWIRGTNVPRAAKQQKLQKLWNIPAPW